MQQLENLKVVSGVCQQSLTYECQGSAFRAGGVQYHWWMSFQNEKMNPSKIDKLIRLVTQLGVNLV